MKKLIATSIGLYLFFSISAFAAENPRIKELTDEGNKLVQEMQQEKADYEKSVSEKQVRVIEISGILKEFQLAEKKEFKPVIEKK